MSMKPFKLTALGDLDRRVLVDAAAVTSHCYERGSKTSTTYTLLLFLSLLGRTTFPDRPVSSRLNELIVSFPVQP